jgi:ABC-type transport system involved in multi-copper enzyme maturation permease subunit
MTQLMAAEFLKLRQRMMTWLLALVLVGLIVLIYSVLWSISGRVTTFGNEHQFTAQELRRALFLQTAVPFSLAVVGSLGIILAAILAAGAAGSEYSWGTVRLMATASKSRLQFITAKLVVVAGLVAVGALLAVIAALVYSSVITFSSGGSSFGFVTPTYVRDQLASYGRTLSWRRTYHWPSRRRSSGVPPLRAWGRPSVWPSWSLS